MHSLETQLWIGRESRRVRLRRIRRGALLVIFLAVAIWGHLTYRADHHTFAWTKPVSVLVVALADPETPLEGEALDALFHQFLSSPRTIDGNLAGIAKWLEDEHGRHSPGSGPVVDFAPAGPLKARTAPPLPPSAEGSFLSRWRGTRDFLGYFEEIGKREALPIDSYDVTVFVYFYDEGRSLTYAGQHSIASRRSRIGVVFAPLGREHLPRCCALIAHELLHTFGASDKYEGERSLFPDGFAEPERSPPHPQRLAEVMALGIPIEPGRERRVEGLSECIVGRKTAEEIGWRKADQVRGSFRAR